MRRYVYLIGVNWGYALWLIAIASVVEAVK